MAKAKTKKQSKTGAVKSYLSRRPSAGPSEVSAALKKQGVNVSPAYVSTIKSISKRAAGNGKHAKRTAGNAASDSVSLAQLVEAGRFAKQVGGIDAAIGLLQSLGKLMA